MRHVLSMCKVEDMTNTDTADLLAKLTALRDAEREFIALLDGILA